MIWRAGLDAKCDYFNATWLAFTGRTLEQESGDGWAEGVHPDDLERCVAHYLAHFERREPFEMEYRLRRHDGVFRWIFDRGVPFTDGTQGFAGFIGSCVDVDERRKAQEVQEQHTHEQLALARDFESWILTIVSHDIRNPLSTIQFAARRLKDIVEPTGTAKKHAAIVEPACSAFSTSSRTCSTYRESARERGFRSIPGPPTCGPCAGRSSTSSRRSH